MKSIVSISQIEFSQKLVSEMKMAGIFQLFTISENALTLSLHNFSVVLYRRKITNAINGEETISQNSQL